jgi:hypothetical protein
MTSSEGTSAQSAYRCVDGSRAWTYSLSEDCAETSRLRYHGRGSSHAQADGIGMCFIVDTLAIIVTRHRTAIENQQIEYKFTVVLLAFSLIHLCLYCDLTIRRHRRMR